jgi:hypothetical protein
MSSRHSRSRSNRLVHSKLPTIQEEVNQPRAKAAPAADLRANLDKNRRGRDTRSYTTNVTANARSGRSDVASTTTASTVL